MTLPYTDDAEQIRNEIDAELWSEGLPKKGVLMSYSREEFEQAFLNQYTDFERFENGEYMDDFLQQSWIGWQARAKTDACCSEIPNSSGSDSEKPNSSEAVAWSWENHGRQVTVDKAFADELISDGEIVRPLIFGDTHPASRQALEGEAIGEVGYMIQPNWDDPSKTKGVALVDKSLAPGTKLYTHPAKEAKGRIEGDKSGYGRIADPALEGEPIGYVVPRMLKAMQAGKYCGISISDEKKDGDIAVYTHPVSADVPDEEYLKALQDAFDIIQADANTEQNYESLCRMGWVLARLKSVQEQDDE